MNTIGSTDKQRFGQAEALPSMATANDVREAVLYLKQRPEGVSIGDVAQPIKRIFRSPKIAAYMFWGLVSRTGERITLTSRGWDFARSLEPEANAYRALVVGTKQYRATLQWVCDQGLDVVRTDQIVGRWRRDFFSVPADDQDVELTNAAVTFFHLCQAAELGTMTFGRRGQPSRLLIRRRALLDYIEAHSELSESERSFEGTGSTLHRDTRSTSLDTTNI